MAKHSHIAVHAVVVNDENGNRVEIKPGSAFTPDKADVESLEARGAIRKATAADKAAGTAEANLDAEAAAANATGYAPGTDTSLGNGLQGNENDALDPEQRVAEGNSDVAAAKAPASRSTLGAKR